MEPKLKLLVGAWHLLKQSMASGNPTAGGFTTMAEALFEVAQLSKRLESEYGIELAVSGHFYHELTVPENHPTLGFSARWNNPRSIKLDQWIKGERYGYYPKIGRIIPPGFGLPESDYGAFIHHDHQRRILAHDLMVYSFESSEMVKAAGAGEGDVIYWTGADGIRWSRLAEGDDVILGHHFNHDLPVWKCIVTGVAAAVKEARKNGYVNSKLLFGGKPTGDSCYLDVFTDTWLEIEGINAINDKVGEPVAEWQGNFCHTRGAGQKFIEGMKMADANNVFGGRIHLNSGRLASVRFWNLLSRNEGVPISKLQQYVDNDFLPGEGVLEWVEDQIATISYGASWSRRNKMPFEVEFDARFCRYPNTIEKLEKSAVWVIKQFQAAAVDEAIRNLI